MNEPIETLLHNMGHLSRPISSQNHLGRKVDPLTGRNKKLGMAPHLKALKKERAMTAHNKTGGLYSKNNQIA